MSQPFLGEIRMISYNFATKGFALCNGQPLPINQNQALYALIGNTYGGNAQSFTLPNLPGRSSMHFGTGGGGTYTVGQKGGEPFHALATGEIPAHNHTAYVSTSGGQHAAAGNLPGNGTQELYDSKGGTNTAMNNAVISPYGGGTPHENRMPFLAVNFIIALAGIYPSRS